MKKEVQLIICTCDVCGAADAPTVTFERDGEEYEIELCADEGRPVKTADAKAEVVVPAQSNGHKEPSNKDIRAWAHKTGKYPDLGDYGQIPATIKEAYAIAHKAVPATFKAPIPAVNGNS
jgi:hypothetical protein